LGLNYNHKSTCTESPGFIGGFFLTIVKKKHPAQLLLLNFSCDIQPVPHPVTIASGTIQLYASGYVVKEASGNVCGDREFRMHQIHSFISYKKYSP